MLVKASGMESHVTLVKKDDWDTLRKILLIRHFQIFINEKYKSGLFRIPIHLAFGHEAIAAAMDRVANDRDVLVLSHRNIHYNIARTENLEETLNEYLLLPTGVAGGKFGSMNLSNPGKGIIYSSSILGNNAPVGCGYGLGNVVHDREGVVFVVTGDGAIEEGAFFESILFAKTHRLPIIFLIENNRWSLATPIEERRYDFDLMKYAESFGLNYGKLTGNDPFQYIKELNNIKERVLEERCPSIIEVEVTTLGSWYKYTNEKPDGHFVNYHAGPVMEMEKLTYPIIRADDKDPLFVLRRFCLMKDLVEISSKIMKEIEDRKL